MENRKHREPITRADCEEKILKELRKIARIVQQYNPENDYLSCAIWIKDGTFMASNRCYEGAQTEFPEEYAKPIDIFSTSDGTRIAGVFHKKGGD